MWISNIIQVVFPVLSTRIMGRPMFSSVTIEVVVGAVPVASAVKHCTIASSGSKHGGRQCSSTCVSHSFNYLTAYTSFLPINQTSSSRMTNQPVVNIGLDQDLCSKLVFALFLAFALFLQCVCIVFAMFAMAFALFLKLLYLVKV